VRERSIDIQEHISRKMEKNGEQSGSAQQRTRWDARRAYDKGVTDLVEPLAFSVKRESRPSTTMPGIAASRSRV
jgi:hypothetical protein